MPRDARGIVFHGCGFTSPVAIYIVLVGAKSITVVRVLVNACKTIVLYAVILNIRCNKVGRIVLRREVV